MDKTGKTRKETKVKSLPCALSEEERMERGGALASVGISIANHKNDLAAESDDFKTKKKEIENKISKLESRSADLCEIVSTGSEKRDVDCESVFDYEAGTVTVRRLDTDEVFEDREMKGLEKQMQLDWESENASQDGDTVSVDPSAVVCEACDGSGRNAEDSEPCENCNGEGVPVVACPECDGTGMFTDAEECVDCEGKGYVLATDTLVIDSEETDGGASE